MSADDRRPSLRVSTCAAGLRAGLSVTGLAFSLVAAAAADTASPGGDPPGPSAKMGEVCDRLDAGIVGDVELETAIVPATRDMPAYCRVSGRLPPQLRFEIRLPEHWNGKLYYGGGGGYNGSIPAPVAVPLRQGYAQVASNSGHEGDGMSAAFVDDNPRAAELFGSQAVPLVAAQAAKVLSEAYGQTPSRSYFEGCSTGGREALMAVQRNPALFDGVIARAPAFNWAGFMGHFNRTAKALAAPGGAFPPAKVRLLAQHVREACDALDGIADGIVSDPAACTGDRTNISSLRCPGGADTSPSCFSDAQLAVIEGWTTDASFADGAYRSKGFPLSGNEDDPTNFGIWVSGNGEVRQAGQFLIQDTTVKHYLARDPGTDSLAYSPWDRNRSALDRMAALNDATEADISPFIENGGKLIVWHGGADAALSPSSTIDYMRRMEDAVGAARAEEATRLYLAPGVGHCAGGPGADETDLLAALDRWVSEGEAPGTLQAIRRDPAGEIEKTVPLCRYPDYPRYTEPAGDTPAPRSEGLYVCFSGVEPRG